MEIIKLKNFSSKLFTLSYPRFRIIVISIVLFFLAILPINLVGKTHNLSICSRLFGKYCYSVGITRGVSCLMKGDFSGAIQYNFLSIPVLLILIGFVFYDLFKIFKK